MNRDPECNNLISTVNKDAQLLIGSDESSSQGLNNIRRLVDLTTDFSQFDKSMVDIEFNQMLITGYIMAGSYKSYDKHKIVLHPYLQVKVLGLTSPVEIFLNHITAIRWHDKKPDLKEDLVVVPLLTHGPVVLIVKHIDTIEEYNPNIQKRTRRLK